MVTQPKRVGVSESIRLRMEPRQARSSHRIVQLLDGAASYIHRHGFETMTTQAVAEASGNSIGTLYRFFEDRIDLLNALVVRMVERTIDAFEAQMRKSQPRDVEGLAQCLFDTMLTMYAKEPGFKSVRLGDPIDIRPVDSARSGNSWLAMKAVESFAEATGGELSANQRIDVELAVVVADALLHKAFLVSSKGHKPTIEQARRACLLAARGGLNETG